MVSEQRIHDEIAALQKRLKEDPPEGRFERMIQIMALTWVIEGNASISPEAIAEATRY